MDGWENSDSRMETTLRNDVVEMSFNKFCSIVLYNFFYWRFVLFE
jgi:hypothetical protein